MCKYTDLNKGICKISKEPCPFLYFCNRMQIYKQSKAMPKDCRVAENFIIPKEVYKVCLDRRGKLYIDVDNNIVILDNPFDYTPAYVKLSRVEDSKWEIKQAMG